MLPYINSESPSLASNMWKSLVTDDGQPGSSGVLGIPVQTKSTSSWSPRDFLFGLLKPSRRSPIWATQLDSQQGPEDFFAPPAKAPGSQGPRCSAFGPAMSSRHWPCWNGGSPQPWLVVWIGGLDGWFGLVVWMGGLDEVRGVLPHLVSKGTGSNAPNHKYRAT